jgi:hypothetical protein
MASTKRLKLKQQSRRRYAANGFAFVPHTCRFLGQHPLDSVGTVARKPLLRAAKRWKVPFIRAKKPRRVRRGSICNLTPTEINQRRQPLTTSRTKSRRSGSGASLHTVATPSRSCLLWVKSRHDDLNSRCPLYPQKRTLLEPVAMSALCQKRTSTRSSRR